MGSFVHPDEPPGGLLDGLPGSEKAMADMNADTLVAKGRGKLVGLLRTQR